MNAALEICCTVNGETVSAMVEPRLSLADFLRESLELHGTRLGCEHGVCAACTVVVDGRTARACMMLAVQADGRDVETIEGATRSKRIADLQDAFVAHGALQCGFCSAGMLLTAAEYLHDRPDPSRADIRVAMAGNYCRCTGYQGIVDAIAAVAAARRTP